MNIYRILAGISNIENTKDLIILRPIGKLCFQKGEFPLEGGVKGRWVAEENFDTWSIDV